jgi:uncharacterized protein YijF (DUF1287 family)
VLIENCFFNTGDDCIAIKSGRNNDGREGGQGRFAGRPSKNIIIRNCEMKNGHGGVVIGSEISGGCQNVFAENCAMDSPNLDRVIRIKTSTARGGVIEGIHVRNVEVGQCREAVLRINLKYEQNEVAKRGFIPEVRDVTLENVTCKKSTYGVRFDGLDDQTDILQSVREYLATEPKYRSKYYASGYPDDEYGVCTDVVAFGLLGAGYDLRELVHEDILAAPDAYGVDKPDRNIDFRRVRNLKVYLDRHAIPLTTDPRRIEQWQGGDIVVFEGHIGVVSEHRNHKGVAWVLHNGSPLQLQYEENILARRDDIIGHYRIS